MRIENPNDYAERQAKFAELADEEWELVHLGLDHSKLVNLKNPLLDDLTEHDLLHPDEHLLNIMMNPEYFGWTCSKIFNTAISPNGLELLPMQCGILQELWYQSFPILLGSRGLGKCVNGATWIISENGFRRIGDLIGLDSPEMTKIYGLPPTLGENGFKDVEYGWNNGLTKTIKLTTHTGFQIENTYEHPMRMVKGDSIDWEEQSNIKIDDYVIIDRSETWFPNTNDLTEDHGYLFGLIVGDGGYTVRGRITFTTNDAYLAEKVSGLSMKVFGKPFKKQKAKYTHLLCGTEIWDKMFVEYGFNSPVCGLKDFPSSILSAKKEVVAAFIRGLMDTDGTVIKAFLGVEFASKSENLVRTLQFMLTRFGIISAIRVRRNKKYNKDYYYLYIFGEQARIFANKIGFGLHRKQEILLKNCETKKSNTNKDVIPHSLTLNKCLSLSSKFSRNNRGEGRKNRLLVSNYQLRTYQLSYPRLLEFLENCESEGLSNEPDFIYLKDLYDKHYYFDKVRALDAGEAQTFDVHIPDDHSFISNGFISHNTFLLAVYCMLRAMFMQGRKIVLTGAGFRQSKLIFGYAELLWFNSPVFRDMCGNSMSSKQGPHHGTDMWEMTIGDSYIRALPMGNDGSKIRGQRAHDILLDEFGCLDASTLVETTKGLRRIIDCENIKNFNLFTGVEGETEPPANFIKTPLTDAYQIKTMGGYDFICSNIHTVFTQDGWKLGKDLSPEDSIYFKNHYKFPKKKVSYEDIIVDKDIAWLMGALVAEGSINSRHTVGLTSTDYSFLERAKVILEKYGIKVGIHTKEAYRDDRGWDSKKCYSLYFCNLKFRTKLKELGLDITNVYGKKIPWSILQSSRGVVISFLSGLFEGDGSAFLWDDRNMGNKFGVAYYTVSEQLAREVQILLHKLDIFCTRQTRSSKLSDKPQWMLRLNGWYALNFQEMVQIPKWQPIYELAHKPSADRKTPPVWLKVKNVELLPGQRHLYDFYLPKSHSFMANCFRQHNSVQPNVFEEVISGFGAVNLDPIEEVKYRARLNKMKVDGDLTLLKKMEEERKNVKIGNQIIISGTATFAFNHFYDYYKKQKAIIYSEGDKEKLKRLGANPNLDYRKYSIIQIPWDMLPEGYMSDENIERSRATLHTSLFANEFGAVFSEDSNGFFKRSLIEKAMPTPIKPVLSPSGEPILAFPAQIIGKPGKKYIYGIDPASQQDNFAITILEVNGEYSKIVYCWTMSSKVYQEGLKSGDIKQNDFFAYCVRKIRDLMKVFPCMHIAMDAQGGGHTIANALHNEVYIEKGEKAIWPLDSSSPLWDGVRKDTDPYDGLHILEMVQPANATYMSQSFHGIKADLEKGAIVFPYFDVIELPIANQLDIEAGRSFDTLQDVILEIEEMKDEFALIEHDATDAGRERWDTPTSKAPGSKKGRLRKDRVSAVVMANMAAIRLRHLPPEPEYIPYGTFVGNKSKVGRPKDIDKYPLYSGPSWYTKAAFGDVVPKRGV